MSRKALTGKELLALIESMPEATKQEIAVAAGYAGKNNRPQLAKYYEAFIEAQGLEVGGARVKRGKPNSAVLHRQKTGMVVIGKTWWDEIGIGLNDNIQLEIDNDSPEAELVGPRIILYKHVVAESVEVESEEKEEESDE